MHMFRILIAWVKDEPFKAGAVLIIVYWGLIIFSMPIVFLSFPLGYAFHEAFDGHISKINVPFNLLIAGFIFGFVVLSTGTLLGGISAFFISKITINVLSELYRSIFAERLH